MGGQIIIALSYVVLNQTIYHLISVMIYVVADICWKKINKNVTITFSHQVLNYFQILYSK